MTTVCINSIQTDSRVEVSPLRIRRCDSWARLDIERDSFSDRLNTFAEQLWKPWIRVATSCDLTEWRFHRSAVERRHEILLLTAPIERAGLEIFHQGSGAESTFRHVVSSLERSQSPIISPVGSWAAIFELCTR